VVPRPVSHTRSKSCSLYVRLMFGLHDVDHSLIQRGTVGRRRICGTGGRCIRLSVLSGNNTHGSSSERRITGHKMA